MNLRDATPTDFDAVLQLNEASVQYLSPLDRTRLEHLHEQAIAHRIAEVQGNVAGFLLAFREGAHYDSVNYRWFARQYESFVYIDRVVVSDLHRGLGIGRALYQDLFRIAGEQQVPYVTCEFDVEPPNEISSRFHAGFGFKEVGSQFVAEGKKKVSLQAVHVLRS